MPPVNVREVKEAVAVLRRAAAPSRPMRLELGPPATFLPDNPVLYLSVHGELDDLHALRDRVFMPPLERDLTWPFVPHVTLADESTPARIEAALDALADYRAEATFTALTLLQEGPGRVWTPVADVSL